MKPGFVVIGAARSGTTSLYHYLRQHPGIFMTAVKELNHLIHHPAKRSPFQGPDVTFAKACRSRDEYLEFFRDAPQAGVIGEIAHIYLYAAESPGLIREVLGAPKIVALIRNPAERAYSNFVMHREMGLEPLATFEEAVELEDGRVKGGWDPIYHYVRRGMYGEQLARYYSMFPESDIRVYKFESFFNDPATAIADLFAFIGADASFVPDLTKKYTPGGDPRAPEFIARDRTGPPEPKQMAPDTRARLMQGYGEDIRTAEHLTGLDLSDWLN